VGCVEWPGGERIDVELLVELADTLPEVQVVIVGDGFDRATATRLRRPNVHLLPMPPRALLPALLASWSAVLRPLRRTGNGAGLVEALASRLPVIASGPPEAAGLDRLGIVQVDGAVALAMAVRAAILEDAASARQRRRASAAFVHAHDAARVAARIERSLEAAALAPRRVLAAPAH
jgi:glycosyltransferase involved in cell wall biosynthesis